MFVDCSLHREDAVCLCFVNMGRDLDGKGDFLSVNQAPVTPLQSALPRTFPLSPLCIVKEQVLCVGCAVSYQQLLSSNFFPPLMEADSLSVCTITYDKGRR